MKFNLLIFTIFSTFMMPSCNKISDDSGKIDLETIDLSLHIEDLIDVDNYVFLENSPIGGLSVYYSYEVDSFRLGTVFFKQKNELRILKPESLGDVYDSEESFNRIDIYTSFDKEIVAIALSINNREDSLDLLEYVSSKKGNENIWTDSRGYTFILQKEEWSIDSQQMLSVNLCIVKSYETPQQESIDSFIDYYNR